MKIAVIGSGAMGCLFSSLLSVKNEVSVFSRNEYAVKKINSDGIKITEKDNTSKIFRPKAFLSGESQSKFDLVIILVKTYDTVSAIEMNRSIIDNAGYVLTLQNGLGNEDVIKNYKSENIIIGTTEHNSSLNSCADITHGGNGITVLGGISEFICKLSENFNSCGIDTIVKENMKETVWKKLALNIAVNALTAIYSIPTGRIIEDEFLKICKELISETVKVAEKEKVILNSEEIFNSVIGLAERQPLAFTSMYKDIKNNRKTEIDCINGAVVKIAEKYNLDCKYNKIMTEKIHILESKGSI